MWEESVILAFKVYSWIGCGWWFRSAQGVGRRRWWSRSCCRGRKFRGGRLIFLVFIPTILISPRFCGSTCNNKIEGKHKCNLLLFFDVI